MAIFYNMYLSSYSSSLCSMGVQLACPAGALSQKHGTIEIDSVNGVRMVLTDQYLPLSGPDSGQLQCTLYMYMYLTKYM